MTGVQTCALPILDFSPAAAKEIWNIKNISVYAGGPGVLSNMLAANIMPERLISGKRFCLLLR